MNRAEFDYAVIEYIEPIVYFRVTKGIVLDKGKIAEIIDAGLKLCNNKPHLLLTDVRVPADVTPDAREIASTTPNVVAQAIVVKWLAQRLIANVFMEINKPNYPMRVFNDEESAVKWLMVQWKKATHEKV